MHRIKDLEKTILRGDGIIAELIEKKLKHGLILPDSVDNSDFADYIEVIAVGNNIKDIKKGDIIVDILGGVTSFMIKDKRVTMLYRGNVILATPAENFDKTIDDDDTDIGDVNI